jgi:hypothetical protein
MTKILSLAIRESQPLRDKTQSLERLATGWMTEELDFESQ